MKPLGINFGTSAQVQAYVGTAGWYTPIYATDTFRLYLCDGTTGTKHEIAMKADLSAYATTAAMNSALGGKADASHTHTTAQVTGLDAALAGKLDSGAKAASATTADDAQSILAAFQEFATENGIV